MDISDFGMLFWWGTTGFFIGSMSAYMWFSGFNSTNHK